MLEMLLLFTFWPWVVFIAFLICLGISSAFETTLFAFISIFVYSGVALLVFGVNPFIWVIENPFGAFVAIGIYVCVGISWSMAKWVKHIKSESVQERLLNAKQYYQKHSDDNSTEG